MPNFERPVNTYFYDQPGFLELENVWYQIFYGKDSDGYELSAKESLEVLDRTRIGLMFDFGFSNNELNELEKVACSYAQEKAWRIENEMEELIHG